MISSSDCFKNVDEVFWLPSTDGRLQVGWCPRCERHLHPSCETCPECGLSACERVEVSGEGTVVACTVSPDGRGGVAVMIAVVALDVDARVTFVAKLVDCAPERARVGLPVRVEFEWVGES